MGFALTSDSAAGHIAQHNTIDAIFIVAAQKLLFLEQAIWLEHFLPLGPSATNKQFDDGLSASNRFRFCIVSLNDCILQVNQQLFKLVVIWLGEPCNELQNYTHLPFFAFNCRAAHLVIKIIQNPKVGTNAICGIGMS
jgi:hypothetical protein